MESGGPAHSDVAKTNDAGRTPIDRGEIDKILEPTNVVNNKLVQYPDCIPSARC